MCGACEGACTRPAIALTRLRQPKFDDLDVGGGRFDPASRHISLPTFELKRAHDGFPTKRKFGKKTLYVQGLASAPTVGYDYYSWCYIVQVTIDLHHRALQGDALVDVAEHMPVALPFIPLLIVTTPSRFLSMGKIPITPLSVDGDTPARRALLAKLKQFVVVLPLFQLSGVHGDAEGALKRARGEDASRCVGMANGLWLTPFSPPHGPAAKRRRKKKSSPPKATRVRGW